MTGSDEGLPGRDLLALEKQEDELESSDAKAQDEDVEQTSCRTAPPQAPTCTEPELPDQARTSVREAASHFASPAPVEGAPSDNDISTHNSLPAAPATDARCKDSDPPEEDVAPEITADAIAAASAAFNTKSEQSQPDAPASTVVEPSVPQSMASEMPPPAFLPRQLRMKSKLGSASWCMQCPMLLRKLLRLS